MPNKSTLYKAYKITLLKNNSVKANLKESYTLSL